MFVVVVVVVFVFRVQDGILLISNVRNEVGEEGKTREEKKN